MNRIFITGCAGFIGSHLAEHFLKKGYSIVGLDNLSRNGCATNLELLNWFPNFTFYQRDIRNFNEISEIFTKEGTFDLIIHEAAQVAVTTSVVNPREDFEINALGTFNMLEATRLYSPGAFFQFASTNKVYGKMDEVEVVEKNGRYEYQDLTNGVNERFNLDFHSPYGCSKGAADQYVSDYSRIYNLQTVVLRQSCIYGTRQFGIEDQGWVAWFIIASLLGRPISVYGDGKQGRDILWIDDLVKVYELLFLNREKTAGQTYNVGGGPSNILSLLELLSILTENGVMKKRPDFADWRPGDQKIFVCDIEKIKQDTGWEPTVGPRQGIDKLIEWTKNNETILREVIK